MDKCPICGEPQSSEKCKVWCHCPKYTEIICDWHCQDCEYAPLPEDRNFLRCRYYVSRKEEKTNDKKIEILKNQIENTQNKIRNLYKKNWPRQAAQEEMHLQRLMNEKRRIESE